MNAIACINEMSGKMEQSMAEILLFLYNFQFVSAPLATLVNAYSSIQSNNIFIPISLITRDFPVNDRNFFSVCTALVIFVHFNMAQLLPGHIRLFPSISYVSMYVQ